MIHITHIASGARFWDDDTAVYGSRYDASVVIQWEGPKAVMLSAFTVNHGSEVTRKMLRELVTELDRLGVQRIRSTREHGRLLPMAKLMPDGTFVNDVAELVAYCASEERRRYPPGLAPKPPAPGQQRRRGEPEWQDTVPSPLSSHPLQEVRATDPPDDAPKPPKDTP